jgi:hypothetical protein
VKVFKRLIVAVRRKRGELWRDRSLILPHDKAPAYSSLRVSPFLEGNGDFATDHALFSPDLAPAHFCLFPELKSALKEKCLGP